MTTKADFKTLLKLFIFLLTAANLTAQDDIGAGKSLFKDKCATCHNKNMKDNLTGPPLAGMEDRWADYPREDLYQWIRNSQEMIQAGHPKAVELWNEFKPTVMTANEALTDVDIENIIAYVNDAATPKEAAGPITGIAQVEEKGFSKWIYWIAFAILAILALILARIIMSLDHLNRTQAGEDVRERSLWDLMTSKGMMSFLIFAIIVIGGYFTVNNAIAFGRQQGYAPQQPIKFSHATHAGIQGIDCQYCHDGARRSKHAVIPDAKTCMNCHAAVKKGSTYGTSEITKIYASIGFNPNTDTYIDNYENYPADSIAAVYTKWIAENYVEDKGLDVLDGDAEEEVAKIWDGVVASLTNEVKPNIQGPIEWIRIHNLPDHVYFNHSQHVEIGGLECQQCHGKVEEMEVLEQFSPLSMGWCVNCHRKTEVQFAGSEYYESYKKYHDEMASGKRDKVTVEDIGGLECQKCHY